MDCNHGPDLCQCKINEAIKSLLDGDSGYYNSKPMIMVSPKQYAFIAAIAERFNLDMDKAYWYAMGFYYPKEKEKEVKEFINSVRWMLK